MNLDLYALWIGRGVMAGAGGVLAICFMLAVYWFAGLVFIRLLKRLQRVYSVTALGYWLERLEETGWYAMRKEIDAAKARGPGPNKESQ